MKVEEETQPNTLLQMQEATNAPFAKDDKLSKSVYVEKIRAKVDAETQYEPAQTLSRQKSVYKDQLMNSKDTSYRFDTFETDEVSRLSDTKSKQSSYSVQKQQN